MGKKLLAGVLGGLAFWGWSAVAHMLLPLGEAGVKEMPDEQTITASIKAGLPHRGLYIFPGTGLPPTATQSEKNAAMKTIYQKMATGPSGLLVYHPTRDASFIRMLLTELGTNIVQMLLAVFLLSQTRLSGFAARWWFVTMAGILAAISTNISYWNWYGFPRLYTLSYTATILIGFVVAGVIAAAMVKPAVSMPSARSAAA